MRTVVVVHDKAITETKFHNGYKKIQTVYHERSNGGEIEGTPQKVLGSWNKKLSNR